MLGLVLHCVNEVMNLSWYLCGAVEMSLLGGGGGSEWFSKHCAFQLLPFPFSLKRRI